jgi:hypothetical protein
MPRSNVNITDEERSAYNAFCQQHNILNDSSPAAIKNGDEIGGYIVQQWLEDITEHTLGVALEQLRDRLTFISPEQAEVQDILGKLDQGQRDTVAAWLAKNHRLEVDGPKGFSNVSVLTAWLINHKFAISEANLNTALGNAMNSGHRKIHWKEPPKADRSYGPGGKLNHSVVNPSTEGFMPKNQTNRTLRQVMEDNRPKVETVPTPVSINVEYQAKAEALQGRSHGQTEMAKKLFVTVPGTSDIDWAQTYRAREKFLTAQAPLIRR